MPPISRIKGVDLTTEGVITLSKVLTYAEDFLDQAKLASVWATQKDGASLIARELFENATDVNFFVGRAINPAHQNPNLPHHLRHQAAADYQPGRLPQENGQTRSPFLLLESDGGIIVYAAV